MSVVVIFAVAPSAHKKAKMTYIALHYMLLNNKGICSLDNKVIKAVKKLHTLGLAEHDKVYEGPLRL